MSKHKKRSRGVPTGVIVLLVLLVLILIGAVAALIWLMNPGDGFGSPVQPVQQTQPVEVTEQTEPETQPAAPVVTADGNSGSIRYAATYTGGSSADGSRVVATYGAAKLTNAQLQLLYQSQIAAWQAGGHAQQPDFTQPLDTQLCPLGDGDLSWQHYFLQMALTGWQAEQALIAGAKEPIILDDPDYKPNETMDLHGTYLYPDLPIHNFLYQDLPCYTPNQMHQAYLDSLEAQMESLAQQRGCKDLTDCAQVYGLTAAELVQAAKDYNFAYMFFTEYTYNAQPTQEEIDTYISKHRLDLPTQTTVDLRHILLIPEDAKIAPDGTVTAEDVQWEACRRRAEAMLESITVNGRSHAFSLYANENSQDEGSKAHGGLYASVTQGQLIPELDEWCFASDRSVGDTAVLRTSHGYHVVKLCDTHSAAEEAAKQILLLQAARQKWCSGKLTADWSKVSLWADQPAFTLADVLYTDVAHERFPEVMVYLQQDFMYSPFGGGIVGKNGCGITTFAMLATYMTDSVKTPAAMARDFITYFEGTGTDGMIFINGSADLDFFCERRADDIVDVIPALENGQMVISLQYPGHFTTAGHYLLVQNYYPENDTFQVRDSNVFNYGRLQGHKDDYFTRNQLSAACGGYWIMQPKAVRSPACTRCGGTAQSLLMEDYFCQRCVEAMARRNCFLALGG